MFEVEAREGRERPIPDYVDVVLDAKYWGLTPMEMLDMPLEWAEAGRIVREAQYEASLKAKGSEGAG